MNWRICFLATTILFLIAACARPEPTHSPLELTSPLQSQSPLDAPSQIVPFRLNKPIIEGTNRVSGTGPVGVPIVIADVTFMGEGLGAGIVGPDGTFVVQVPVLEKNHFIGLSLGDLTKTQWKPKDFYAMEYRGDGAMQVPQVGFFHDTAMVVVKE
jgi:hypothetical protein